MSVQSVPILRRHWILVRWIAASIVVVVAFLTTGVLVRDAVSNAFAADERQRTVRSLLVSAFDLQLDEETGLRGYADTGDTSFLDPYYAALTVLPAKLSDLQAQLRALGLTAADSAALDAAQINREWLHTVAQPLIARRGTQTVELQVRGKVLVDRYRKDVTVIDSSLTQSADALDALTQRDIRRISLYALISTLVFLAGGISFALLQLRAAERADRERESGESARSHAVALQAAYQTEKGIADMMQSAIAQRDFPDLAAVSFSARYVPSTEKAQVGGDWYDVRELGPGRALFVVGDIAGHGIEAAVAMNRVRNAVVSAALVQPDPASILRRVNSELIRAGDVPVVSVAVGVVDSARYYFEYALAGAPPPVLWEPNAAPRVLETGSIPLGIREIADYRTNRLRCAPESLLVLCTDGVIERSRDVIDGERRLLSAIARVDGDGWRDPADFIYRSIFGDGKVADDVAILTIRLTGAATSSGPTAHADKESRGEDGGSPARGADVSDIRDGNIRRWAAAS